MEQRNFKYVLLFLVSILYLSPARSQLDTVFWFVAPEVTSGHDDRPIYMRMTSWGHSATATISYPARPWSAPIVTSISANTTVSVNLTTWIDSIENKPANTILNYGILIHATNTITAYYEEASTINPEIFTLKGAQALGLDFYIPTQNQFPNKSGLTPAAYNSFDIVATENNTQVTITPSNAIVGHAAGVPFVITLNKGQTYSAQATGQSGAAHLYGSRVTSNKPIAITEKDDSVNPTGYGCYDLEGDQIVPVSVLGQDFVAILGSLSFNDWIYVIAAHNGTQIFFNGNVVPAATINAGGIYAYQFSVNILFIHTSQPAYVWHESGFGCELGSTLLPPILCTGSNAVSVTRTTNEYFGVNLITSTAGKTHFLLNGAAGVINGGAFSAVPGTSNNYWAARIDLSSYTSIGVASTITNTTSLFHLGVIHGGSSSGVRYGYFSGYSNLYLGPDRLICSADTLTLDGGDYKDSYHWSTGDTTKTIKVWYTDTLWVRTVQNTCVLYDTIIIRALPSPHATFAVTSDTIKCQKSNLFSFHNNSTISSGSLTYLWKFGDNTTSTTIHSTHNYLNPGTYFVRLIATSLDGCKDSLTRKVYVYPSPVVNFTMSDTARCFRGNSFTFTNTTTINPIRTMTYIWTFGDAFLSTITSPVHSYLNPGTFQVKLVSLSDQGCTDTIKKNLNVFATPLAGYTVNDTDQCFKGNNFVFTNNSSVSNGTMTYLWKFGDNGTSGLSSTSHSYTSANTYNVRLIATSNHNCKDSLTKKVYVYPSPVANFNMSDTARCFKGNSFTFTNTTTINPVRPLTYIWTFGDVFLSTLTSPVHSYLNPGTFQVKLVSLSDQGCTDTIKKSLNVFATPLAGYTVNDTDQCFKGNNFVFTNNSSIGNGTMTYLWKFGDNGTSGLTSTSHSYTSASTYTVRLIATSNHNCKDSLTKKVYVYPSPVANFNMSDTARCFKGNSFTFTNTTTVNPVSPLTYIWTFGDAFLSTLTSPVHSYLNPGTFQVKLVSLSDQGCTDTIKKSLNVFATPLAGYTVNDTDQCFKGNNFVFTNNSSVSNGTMTYLWKFGDNGTSGLTSTSHSYTSANTYNIKLIVTSNHNCKDSLAKNMYVFPSPVANFNMSDTARCFKGNSFTFTNTTTVNPIRPLTYVWTFGDAFNSALTSPVHSYLNTGLFQVKLVSISDQGCTDTIKKSLNVYSSPVAGYLVNDSSQCLSGNSFVFSNHTTIQNGSLVYTWKFGDGSLSAQTNPVHIYLTPDTFQVRMVAISNKGCKDSSGSKMYVFPMPAMGFSISDSTQCLKNNQVNFTNTSGILYGNLSYLWSFGDGDTSHQVSPKHKYLTFDTFQVKLKAVSSLGCADSLAKKTYIFPMPKTSFSINDTGQCFRGNNFIFTNLTTIPWGTVFYFWNFGDLNISAARNPTHS